MTDFIDDAQARDSQWRDAALAQAREAAKSAPRILPTGYCHNPRCGDDFEPGSAKRFCGPACSNEYSRLGGK